MWSDLLNNEVRGTDSSVANLRRTRLCIPSGPIALPSGSDFKITSVSEGIRVKVLSSEITLYRTSCGSLAFSTIIKD